MTDLGNTDWWPESPVQSMWRQRNVRPTEGERGYDATMYVDNRVNPAEPGMGFTMAEFDAASLDNVALNMVRDMKAKANG